MPVLIAKDKIEEIKRLIEDGLSQREVEQITGINRGSISRIAARGFTVGSHGGRKRGGKIAMSIDKHDIDAYKAEPGKRLDGTPDLDYSPAFADDGDDVPFAEPLELPNDYRELGAVDIKASTLTRTVHLQGQFASAHISGDVTIDISEQAFNGSVEKAEGLIDKFVNELNDIKAAIIADTGRK